MDILLEYAGNDSFVSVQIVVNKGKTIYYSLDLCNKNDFFICFPGCLGSILVRRLGCTLLG